jgi:hypothetical protein
MARNSNFGSSVALSGNGSTAVVGAPSTENQGDAYVFVNTNGVWSQGPDLALTFSFCQFCFGQSPGNSFGSAVALPEASKTIRIVNFFSSFLH